MIETEILFNYEFAIFFLVLFFDLMIEFPIEIDAIHPRIASI